jgi:steroid delta-isomerase-like uncharacterized protein
MSEEQVTALAKRWFLEVWNQRNDATVHELLSPEAVGHLEGFVTRGPAEFLAMRASLLGAFPDLQLTVEDVLAQGRQAVVRWSGSGTHSGGTLGFAATNKPAVFRGMTWLRVANGQIVEGWDSWNLGGLIAALQGS